VARVDVIFSDYLLNIVLVNNVVHVRFVDIVVVCTAGAEAGCVGAEGTEQNPRGHQGTE